MLDLLIGGDVMNIIKIVLAIFVVITILTLMAEYEFMRWVFGIPLFIVLVFSGLYSYGQINRYYSASGGIHGKLTDLIDPNRTYTTLKKDDLTINFKNLNLTKNEHGIYQLSKDETLVLEFNTGDVYEAYINGYPCQITKLSIGDDDSKFIYKFSYIFANYDDNGDLEIIADDTIQIEFTFYKSHTNVKIKTNCSDEIVGLWNSYFNKNNFEIELKKVENLQRNLLAINANEGEL